MTTQTMQSNMSEDIMVLMDVIVMYTSAALETEIVFHVGNY
jgi:hypothetical protein